MSNLHVVFPIITVFLVALLGVSIFSLLSFPMPWMLGSLFGVLLSQFLLKVPYQWPVSFRNIGLAIVGTAIGQLFTLELLLLIRHSLIFILILNIFLCIFSIFLAFIIHRVTKISLPTAITASIPGGISQLVVFAEEQKNLDVTVITFFHIVRVISVVGFIPFIVSITNQTNTAVTIETPDYLYNLFIIFLGFLVIPIGKKLRLPVPYFLTPVILGLLLSFTPLEPVAMNDSFLHIAQLTIGAYIGLMLKSQSLHLKKSILISGVLSALLLITLTFGIAEIMVCLYDMDFKTSFLSTAPGGMDQMGLIATAVHADATQVTVFQLFRMLFIYVVILPILKWYFTKE
ncbi:ammonia monooxygenase [Ureibacillus manganicus DSM 26584]|uniref:Ammonia monooxygenase n=1 Tax=Ureibacillus manganicus DSM 26584 TaxID=1384049 RepID=A0A0A3I5D3_9BACL|nr:ammonia monooxygenase [Ureibacillus manganicus DSM 26584]